ncbi:MAG: extracellular solute-binding protein [Clostridia bacterium]|nr:extracellular solute-binding protein [Clostridia bacterium]
MKKLVALLTAMLLALSVFAGWTAAFAEDAATMDLSETYAKLEELGIYDGEPITLNVYSQLANYSGLQGHWSADLLLDMFNVKINIIPESDGTYSTRMESGNLGDIVVWGSDGDNYQQAVKQGKLLDWEEDGLAEEYAPYIWKNYQLALESNRARNEDGKIHGFGHGVALEAGSHQNFFYTWDLRWDLYKQLGYPKVKDLDGMIDLFKQMKEICPTDENGNETYAVSVWPDWDGNMVMYAKSLATAYYGWDEFELGLINPENGEFQGCLQEDGMYIEMLRFFNKLYREGLLDPNSASQNFAAMSEKVKAGGTFWSIFNYAGSSTYNTVEHLNEGKYMGAMVPDEGSPIVYGLDVTGGSRLWTVGADAEYPELCLALLDYLATPEGSLVMWYGPKGLTWDYDEEGGTCFTELGQKTNQDPQYDMTGVTLIGPRTGKEYPQSGTYNDGALQINNVTLSASQQNPDSRKVETLDKEGWVSVVNKDLYPIQQDWCDWAGAATLQEYLDKRPYRLMPSRGDYSPNTRDQVLDTKWSQIKTEVKTGSWRAIYAKNDGEFNFHVTTMINNCKAYGYADCVAWCEAEAARCWEAMQAAAALVQ